MTCSMSQSVINHLEHCSTKIQLSRAAQWDVNDCKTDNRIIWDYSAYYTQYGALYSTVLHTIKCPIQYCPVHHLV